jgi:gamma-glutamyltranspeptidase/glutathione hydrolase
MASAALFLPMIVIGLVDEPQIPRKEQGFMAEGRNGIVVGLTGRRAVHAGIEILKQGGSAADAAMTTAMAQVVEAAGSYISFAGVLSMTYLDTATGKVRFLNACFNTPLDEKDPLSIPKLDPFASGASPSGRSVLVPGFMAGVEAGHDRFGRLPLDRIVEPAIRMAEEGFEVDASLAGLIQFRKDVLSRLPETRRIFTKPDNKFYERGDRFRQPELAATLRAFATQGAAYFYTGDWSRRFVAAMRNDGGVLTGRDLQAYKVLWEEPLETSYGDARLHAPGPSSGGGVDIIEALNLVELAGLKKRGLPTQSAESLFWLMQISRNQIFSFSHNLVTNRFPDRDFSPKSRVTKQSAQWIWDRMLAGAWPFSIKPKRAPDKPVQHSSGVVVVDRWGNVAAVTHSIYTAVWGRTGIFVGGVSIPDSASFQQEAIKEAGPDKRLADSMCPLIVTRRGKPVLASTVIGGGLHQRNLFALTYILEFGMDAQAAAHAPAILLPDEAGGAAMGRVAAGAFDHRRGRGARPADERAVRPRESPFHWLLGRHSDRPTGGSPESGRYERVAQLRGSVLTRRGAAPRSLICRAQGCV